MIEDDNAAFWSKGRIGIWLSSEADTPALRDRRVHELADGSEDGARAVENCRGHDCAMFCEDIRQVLAMLAAAGL
jgi:hypothetical protein